MNRIKHPTTARRQTPYLNHSQREYNILYSFNAFLLYSNSLCSFSETLRQRTGFLKGNSNKLMYLRDYVTDSDGITQFKDKYILINLRQFKTIIQTNRYINLKNRPLYMESKNIHFIQEKKEDKK